MDSSVIILLIIVGIAIFVGIVVLEAWMERKRREAFQALADELQLTYSPRRRPDLAERLGFLNLLDEGQNRYAQHVFEGVYEGMRVLFFEYHYETTSQNSKGGKTTHHHYLSVFTTEVPGPVPEITIRPEGIFSKVAQAFGYDDIDFESAEFSRKYCVRSRDKRFAYDVCHPMAIEFLLRYPYVDFEIEGNVLALVREYSLQRLGVIENLDLLTGFRHLWPDHLKGTCA